MTSTVVVRRIALVLAAYLALALVGRHATAQKEVFPFFAFDLFSRLPAPDEAAAVIFVHEVADGPLPEPVPIVGSPWLKGSGVILASLARELMTAAQEDPARARELAQIVAANHFKPGVVRWSVRLEVRDLYARDPLDATRSYPMAWFGEATPLENLRWEDGTLFTAGRELRFDPTVHGGLLESVTELGDGKWLIEGWAGDADGNALPDLVVVLDEGDQPIAITGTSVRRPDVGRAMDAQRLNWAGFRLVVDQPPSDLRLVAVFGDVVRDLGRRDLTP